MLPDPFGRYIADVDRHLRIVTYDGQEISAPEFPGDPVQQVVWAPRGDALLAITGKPTPECCDLFTDARYWLVPVPQGTPRAPGFLALACRTSGYRRTRLLTSRAIKRCIASGSST
jgi:hypothetical protein